MKLYNKQLLMWITVCIMPSVFFYCDATTGIPDKAKLKIKVSEVGLKKVNLVKIYKSFAMLVETEKYRNIAIASSFISERYKPNDFFHPKNIKDNNKETAWAFRNNRNGTGEFIFFTAGGLDAVGYREHKQKPLNLELKFINGYAKNTRLYYANQRVKTALLEIYEAEEGDNNGAPYLISDPILNKRLLLHL